MVLLIKWKWFFCCSFFDLRNPNRLKQVDVNKISNKQGAKSIVYKLAVLSAIYINFTWTGLIKPSRQHFWFCRFARVKIFSFSLLYSLINSVHEQAQSHRACNIFSIFNFVALSVLYGFFSRFSLISICFTLISTYLHIHLKPVFDSGCKFKTVANQQLNKSHCLSGFKVLNNLRHNNY
jgi:hypothetical protein